MKYTFPLANSLTTLAWGMLEFSDGYDCAGERAAMMDNLRWGLDYLKKCILADNRVVAMVRPHQSLSS